MKRKTRNVPSIIYKYRLKPPTTNADLVDETFREARRYYNTLVTIENRRRYLYRRARRAVVPEYAAAEAKVAQLELALASQRAEINHDKSASRTRQVDASRVAATKSILAELKTARHELTLINAPLKLARQHLLREELATKLDVATASGKEYRADKCRKALAQLDARLAKTEPPTPEAMTMARALLDATSLSDAEASAAAKKLRKTLYWGTYLLVEAAFRTASLESSQDVAYDLTPAHLLRNRIGVHWVHGTSPEKILTDTSTLMQVTNPPEHRVTKTGNVRPRYQHDPDGSVKRCVLRLRVASTEEGSPVWAEFPIAYERPLPSDSRLKDAYVVRSPLNRRNPWLYELCICLEAPSHERTTSSTEQRDVTAVNFGWRQMPTGALRVAMVNREGQTPSEIQLTPYWVRGWQKCRQLQTLLDEKFDAVRLVLGEWVTEHQATLPEDFTTSFANLAQWKSQHRLRELVEYWQEHRVPGDEDVWPVVEEWLGRYLHLGDWMCNQRRRLQAQRQDLYRRVAKELATTSRRIILDTFKITSVARRLPPEEVEEGGQAARRNRTLAAVSDLREHIKRAAGKYHCEIVAAPTKDGTRRCNVCGELYQWDPAKTIEHTCPGTDCGATWDQDVNNTDNLHDASASGDVVPLVRPAKIAENGDFLPSLVSSLGAARGALTK